MVELTSPVSTWKLSGGLARSGAGVAAIVVASLVLSGCYTLRVAWHHNDLMNQRRRVADVVDDPATPAATQAALATVAHVLSYAESVGLNAKGAYGYYIELDRAVVSFLVQAAEADRLEPVTWWFPIVGRVPYVGFFDADERDARADELKALGYDVHRGGAGAFSSLGWFDDPIFSSMLKRSRGDLAHLLLHELTHRTMWIAGWPAFNENLAEYAGETLARDYLVQFGSADELTRFDQRRADRRKFHAWIARLRQELAQTYARLSGGDRAKVLAAKREIFARFEGPLKPHFERVDYVAGEHWNHASLLGASLYAPDMARFANAQACVGGRVVDLLAALEKRLAHAANPERALDQLCAAASQRAE